MVDTMAHLPELMDPATASGTLGAIGISGTAKALNWGIGVWKGKLKSDQIESSASFDSVWKISQRCAMKGKELKKHWNKLLLAAIDPENDHGVRMEDIEFMDTLNPADALIIQVMTLNYPDRKSVFKGPNFEYADILGRIMINADERDYYEGLLDNFIPSKAMKVLYKTATNVDTTIPDAEFEASFVERINKYHRLDNKIAIFEVKGWHEQGSMFYPAATTDMRTPFERIIWSDTQSGHFVIGKLTYRAERLGKILNNPRFNFEKA